MRMIKQIVQSKQDYPLVLPNDVRIGKDAVLKALGDLDVENVQVTSVRDLKRCLEKELEKHLSLIHI